jgi:hypothetical protein
MAQQRNKQVDPDFESDNHKYDPAEFIIPASDSKGHSERAWCRLSPGHDRQLDIVLRSRRFPYRTKGDIIRHAIVRTLKWLESMEDVPSVLGQVDMMMDILRDEQMQQEFIAMFEAMQRVIGNHVSAGATGEARRLVAKMKMQIQKMPDGHWKNRYHEELDTKFGYLLEAQSGMKVNRKAAGSGSGND